MGYPVLREPVVVRGSLRVRELLIIKSFQPMMLLIRYGILLSLFVTALSVSGQVEQDTVYVTRTGEKYHLSHCQYLKNSSIAIAHAEAEKLGYTPCSVCKPTRRATTVAPATSTTVAKPVASRQCTGMTQKGQRCKRMTTNVNGRCYQH